MAASKVLIVDNGAYTAKAGYSTATEPRIVPNCITKAKSERRRQFIGDQIEDCKDVSGLFYILPFQKGYLVNWDVEKQVWDYMFGKEVFNVDFADTCLVVTEPYFNFTSIQENMTEILFEEYQFHSILRINGGTLSAYKYGREHPKELGCLLVDCGFSFTHIAPYVKGKKLRNAIRRINVGGKALTNHLKDIISYRQLHVMDETFVMNQVKEDTCFVSTQLAQDLQVAAKKGKENTIAHDYVLPDYTVIKRGYVKPPEETSTKPADNEQIIRMNNERLMVPEILFHPSDIGIREMGISETILNAMEAVPEDIQPHMYKNIFLTGGSVSFPGFKERLFNDVRSLAPDLFDVNVSVPKVPVVESWQGGVMLAKDPEFHKLIVTKKQYEEHGMSFCLDKMDV